MSNTKRVIKEMMSDEKESDVMFSDTFEKRTGYRGKINYKDKSFRLIKSDKY